MYELGGFLMNGSAVQSKLLVDPFEVIRGILESADQAENELSDTESQMEYLFQLFSTSQGFLQSVQASLKEVEEFGRAQIYLPVSYDTLLPEELRMLMDGDPAAFNAKFREIFFDESGNVNEDAVLAALNELGAQIQASGSTIASNMYVEGVLNSKILGIELAQGRIFGGVLPDPENPDQTVDLGNTALTVTGAIPWLGDLAIEMVIDQQLIELPEVSAGEEDPFADLRSHYGESVPVPRGRIEASLDTERPTIRDRAERF